MNADSKPIATGAKGSGMMYRSRYGTEIHLENADFLLAQWLKPTLAGCGLNRTPVRVATGLYRLRDGGDAQ